MTKECSQQLMKDEKRPDEEKLVQETLGKKGNELLTYPDHHRKKYEQQVATLNH